MPDTFVIGGNVCTPQSVIDLQNWGCDAIKCGIGGGSACTTYHSTGFGNRGWQANMILECSSVAKVPIIADGSIKQNCDVHNFICKVWIFRYLYFLAKLCVGRPWMNLSRYTQCWRPSLGFAQD